MLIAAALTAAVAGGNLAVTVAPVHPHPRQRIEIRATGQVGDSGGWLYIYRARARCADTARAEDRRGRRVATRAIDGSFDFELRLRARRFGREWVCGYLYAITCDALGRDCVPEVGLPPDAGFDRVRVTLRK